MQQDSYLICLHVLRDLRYTYVGLKFIRTNTAPAMMYTAITVVSRGIKHFDMANLSGVMMLYKGNRDKSELLTATSIILQLML